MATNKITALDIFNSLTPAEKRKALKVLQSADQSPCQARGHKYKRYAISGGLFGPTLITFICEKCGDSITR